MKKKIMTGAAAGVAALGLLLGGASAANALSYTTSTPVSGLFTVSATSTSTTLPADTYRVGVCTTYGIGAYNAPACGGFGGDIVTTTTGPVSGTTAAIPADGMNIPNDHAALPGHDPEFSCENEGDCEVVLVKHTARGGTPVPGESSPIF